MKYLMLALFLVGCGGSSKQTPPIINEDTYKAVDLFQEARQLSTFIEADRELRNGLNLGFISAFDTGDLLYDSFGCFLRVSKSF